MIDEQWIPDHQLIFIKTDMCEASSLKQLPNVLIKINCIHKITLTLVVSTGFGTNGTYSQISVGPLIKLLCISPNTKQGSTFSLSLGSRDSATAECFSGGPYFSLPCSSPKQKRALQKFVGLQ